MLPMLIAQKYLNLIAKIVFHAVFAVGGSLTSVHSQGVLTRMASTNKTAIENSQTAFF